MQKERMECTRGDTMSCPGYWGMERAGTLLMSPERVDTDLANQVRPRNTCLV